MTMTQHLETQTILMVVTGKLQHCGDGNMRYGIGNHNSIGIEMCISNGVIAEATINNTLELVKHLMNKYNIDLNHVVRHYDASRKNCPSHMSANNWAKWYEFKSRLAGTPVSQPISQPVANSSDIYSVSSYTPTHEVVLDDFYVRDSNGVQVAGRQVDKGDQIQLLDIKGELAEIIYPTANGYVHGFIKYISYMLSPIQKPAQVKPVAQIQTEPIKVQNINAVVENDFFYTRDKNGNIEQGHRIDIGDHIRVIDISASTQLVLVEYPVGNSTRQAYIKNVTSNIKYLNAPTYINGSKTVYDRFSGSNIGSVCNENVIVLEDLGDKFNVAYCTSKGQWTKSGVINK
jgi:hypothetical protein